ncbi:B-cell differentiation antigen CD72-like [Rhea pennata]|uniref:B-cell differentiation antigen CD72-like n=1 Tax=Rhea pennata TaxID=8795 RepID=UPI002E2557E1
MAQSVVYADLRFARVPVGRSTPCQTLETALCEDEAESPYENVQPEQAPTAQDGRRAQPSPGRWRRLRSVPAGLLAACLLLLATALALGLCYWQAARGLQDASRAHAAERGRLAQQASEREQSLEQAQRELAGARAELQRAWLEGNGSRRELGQRDAELQRLAEALRSAEKELRDAQGRLEASERAASSLRACVSTGCCPSGWVLYSGKCLFISAEKKTWWDSRSDCQSKTSVLLVQGPWPSWTLPAFVAAPGAQYWVGVKVLQRLKMQLIWLDSKFFELYEKMSDCGLSSAGKIESTKCMEKHPWICEQAPEPSSASDKLVPLLTKG